MQLRSTSVRLLYSMFSEYMAVDLFFKIMGLKALLVDASPILGSVYFSMSFIGPVFCGPLSGYLTDCIGHRQKWKIPLMVSVVLGGAWVAMCYGMVNLTIFLGVILSVIGYLSANIRIAISKYLIPQDGYSQYHTGVVLILELIPLIAPVLAIVLIEANNNVLIYSNIGVFLMMFVGIFILRGVICSYGDYLEQSKKEGVNNRSLKEKLIVAYRSILKSKEFLLSIYIASAMNLLVLSFGYLSIEKMLRIDPEIKDMSALILSIMSVGGIMGGFLVVLVKKLKFSNAKLFKIYVNVGIALASIVLLTNSPLLIAVGGLMVGVLGSLVSILVWNIRLSHSDNSNIGILAGVTGSLYKILPLLVLPVIGILNAKGMFVSSAFLVLGFLVVPNFFWIGQFVCKLVRSS